MLLRIELSFICTSFKTLLFIIADEREPYSLRTVKLPPPIMSMNNHNPEAMPESAQQMKSALARVRSQDGIWSSPSKSKSSSITGPSERRASPSELKTSPQDGAWSPPTKPKTGSRQLEKRDSPSDMASRSQNNLVAPTDVSKNGGKPGSDSPSKIGSRSQDSVWSPPAKPKRSLIQSEKSVSPTEIASRSQDGGWVPATKSKTNSTSSQNEKSVGASEQPSNAKNDLVSSQSENRASPSDATSR